MHINHVVKAISHISKFLAGLGVEPGLTGIRDVLTAEGSELEVSCGEARLRFTENPGWKIGRAKIGEGTAGVIFKDVYQRSVEAKKGDSEAVLKALETFVPGRKVKMPWQESRINRK